MARYSAFLGRHVEVFYRAGEICLPASGTFVADSGRSIFLEQHFEQHGQPKNFRWEIPYPCIIRLEELQSFKSVARSDAPVPTEALTPSRTPLHARVARASVGSAVSVKKST